MACRDCIWTVYLPSKKNEQPVAKQCTNHAHGGGHVLTGRPEQGLNWEGTSSRLLSLRRKYLRMSSEDAGIVVQRPTRVKAALLLPCSFQVTSDPTEDLWQLKNYGL